MSRRLLAIGLASIVVGVTMLALDLTWLGLVARKVYDEAMGPLKRPDIQLLPATLFYALYVLAIVVHAVIPSGTPGQALRRGAGLGLVAYATYDLTCWAVIVGWPVHLVPIDLGWGVLLTSVVSWVGRSVYQRFDVSTA